MASAPRFTAQRLAWRDLDLGTIPFPARPMHLLSGFGSGLTRRAGDPPGTLWATGDRGPNVSPKVMAERYGLSRMDSIEERGAKVMPQPEIGPAIACLRIGDGQVELVEQIRLTKAGGTPVSGLPPRSSDHARSEPAYDLDGNRLPPDPSGLDTEGIVAFANGEFLLGDEFGPSLVRVDESGRMLARHVPQGCAVDEAGYPVHPDLPAIAAKRQLNRGFEALALSPDEQTLYLAFQSPLAWPDEAAHKAGRHLRIWALDARTLQPQAQYAYPLDPPESFRRDVAKGEIDWSDLKVSELVALDARTLLVLERASATTKLYRVQPGPGSALGQEHWDSAHRPTLEELSAQGSGFPALGKTLLLSTDDTPQIGPDLEGMAVLSPNELLLVSDNDFGVEGAQTQFWRLTFAEPLLG